MRYSELAHSLDDVITHHLIRHPLYKVTNDITLTFKYPTACCVHNTRRHGVVVTDSCMKSEKSGIHLRYGIVLLVTSTGSTVGLRCAGLQSKAACKDSSAAITCCIPGR